MKHAVWWLTGLAVAKSPVWYCKPLGFDALHSITSTEWQQSTFFHGVWPVLTLVTDGLQKGFSVSCARCA